MSLLKKEERLHFIRDTRTGKVIGVKHEGEPGSEAGERGIKNRMAIRDTWRRERNERKYEKRMQQEKERAAFRESYNQARIERARKKGRVTGMSQFPFSNQPTRVVHVHHGKPRKKKKGKQGLSPWEFQRRMLRF